MLNKILAKMGTAEGCRGKFGKINLKVAAETPRWHFLTTLTIEMLDIALICWYIQNMKGN